MKPADFYYLACPYSHPDKMVRDSRVEWANIVSSQLIVGGILVFSPLSHSAPIEGMLTGPHDATWEYWMALDMAIIESPRCVGVLVLCLDGWEDSKGVRAEIEFAESLGKPVHLLTPEQVEDWRAWEAML